MEFILATLPRLSVLDVAAVGPEVTAQQALCWTTEVAKKVEHLGYHRLWVAEHHGVPDIGSSAPAVLLAHLAARTSRLRLGSGGVMLPNHPPLIVAEQFSTLQALHPGRIDLGIGRATGAEPLVAQALGRGSDSTDLPTFVEKLDELVGFLNGRLPVGHKFDAVRVSPGTDPPPLYLLGSSVGSAHLAAERGLPFAFAHHLAPGHSISALKAYRAYFRPSAELARPYAIVTALVVCAEEQEIAERAAIAAVAIRVRRRLAAKEGKRATARELYEPVLNGDEAWLVSQQLKASGVIMGDPAAVHRHLIELAQATVADEVMLSTLEYDGPGRLRTLTAVASPSGAA